MAFGSIKECDRFCYTCPFKRTYFYSQVKDLSVKELIDMLNSNEFVKIEIL